MTPEESITLHDMLDAAAKRYPVKALAEEVDKAESTLRNELVQQPGYKLGLVTAIKIMERTGDLAALDWIEAKLDRVAVPIPQYGPSQETELVNYAGKISKETGEVLTALAESMKIGKLSANERCLIRKETYEALKALAALWVRLKKSQ